MKIIITESQFKMLKENREKFDSLFNKIADEGWESLTPQEQDYVKRFSEWSTTGKRVRLRIRMKLNQPIMRNQTVRNLKLL